MMSFKDEFEDGSIILVMMLILIAGSSYVLITQLNESTRRLTRSQETVDVLNQAKRALISFAVTYPERTGVAASMGPGHFPCPGSVVLAAGESLDTYDGDAPGNCSYNGAVPTLGLLPWEELSLGRLRDANGDYLWYAVSNNFRTPLAAGLTALNSDTPSLMTVNGTPDIVAVIFAPGDLQAGQNNRPSGNDPTQYLEGIAANVTNDDYAFNQIGNDEIITITKQELMTAVEKRILGDISQAFTNYQAAYGAFPWLTPFNNPDTTDFRGIVQVAGLPSEYQGHIPHHWLADPDSAVNGGAAVGRNPFTTNLQISWDILNAQIDDLDGTNLIDDQVLSDSTYNDPIFGVNSPIIIPDATCTWIDRATISCTGTLTMNMNCPNQCGGGVGNCQRVYQIDLQYSGAVNINPPTAISVRTRDVSIINDTLPIAVPANWSVRVDDIYTRNWTVLIFCWNFARDDAKTLTIDGDTTGTIVTQGIQYDMDMDGLDLNADGDFVDNEPVDLVDYNGDGDQLDVEAAPEFPTWFAGNNWQDYIYIAYPSSEVLPGSVAACSTAGASCLTLNNTTPVAGISNAPRALAIHAGADISGNRPSNDIADYLEGENIDIDDAFIKFPIPGANNDQVRILAEGGP